MKARPVVGSDGEVVRVVGTLGDVTEAKTAEERILHDAVHDNLTGLPNRRLFLDRLDAALALARTEDSVRPTVIVLDLDRFKQINESVGLPAGDSILLAMARRLGAAAEAAGHAGPHHRRPVRHCSCCPSASPSASPCWPTRSAAWSPPRWCSATARSS